MKQGTPGFDECTNQPLPDAFSALSRRLAQLNSDQHCRYGDMPLIVRKAQQLSTIVWGLQARTLCSEINASMSWIVIDATLACRSDDQLRN
jgi:hypothetical protein